MAYELQLIASDGNIIYPSVFSRTEECLHSSLIYHSFKLNCTFLEGINDLLELKRQEIYQK
jgi:hypothetical protein